MRIVEVNDKRSRKAFLELPVELYKNDPFWVRPWDHDIEKTFDPAQNPYFQHGKAKRWLLEDESGRVIGRVAAFINEREAFTFEQPTGGMGFFECIDDREAAFMLFDQCKNWLQAQGMEAMDGPVNFGEKNTWWGLLVEGNSPPVYGMPYHARYYRKLFEDYGFQTYYEQYMYERPVNQPLGDRYQAIGERVIRNGNYSFPRFDKKRWKFFAEAFRHIYNKAWVTHENFQPMQQHQAEAVIQQLLPVLDEDFVVFCFQGDEPAGFFINMPDINQIIRHLSGKFGILEKLRFLYMLKTRKINRLFGLAIGVTPEYQRKGVVVAMGVHAKKLSESRHEYKIYEMGWVGDFNPAMIHIYEQVGGAINKTMITYRKLFDETQPFKRRPIIKD